MRVAVTGASGSIASYVLRELRANDWELVGVGRNAPSVDGVPFVQATLDDAESLIRAFAGVDAVVHLAAVPGPFWAPPTEIIDTNVTGTARVLEAGVRAGVQKIVFASSGAATGFSFPERELLPRYLPLDEEHPCEPDDAYGLSKLLGELACARWTRVHGLSTICLRINHNWYVDHEGAETALRCGWLRGMTLEQLWQRYRDRVLDHEDELARQGSVLPRHFLWAVTDARDAAQAFRLALEDNAIEHGVFLINGADTCSLVESETLLAHWFPNVERTRALPGFASLISHDKATAALNYQPRYTWRDSDFSEWLSQNTRTLEGVKTRPVAPS